MRKKSGWIRNKISIAILLIFFSAIVYSNSLENPFQFDDFHHIRDNLSIRNIKNIPSFFTDAQTFSVNPGRGHSRPLLLVTLAFHVGSAFLIFLIVQAMLSSSVDRPSGLSTLAAASIVGDKPPRYNQP